MRRCFALPFAAFLAIASIPASLVSQISPAHHPPNLENYGQLPLSFEANQGQAASSVQFLSHGQGYTLLLRPNLAVFALRNSASASRQSSAVSIVLAGANPNAAASREDPQITRTNYFLGNNPALWKTDIPNYGRIRYRSVYDGVDLLYYGNQHRLEHDFIVAPHADPSKIVLSLNGARRVTLDPATGDLVLASEPGQPSLRLLKPFTYQQADHAGSRRIPIDSNYRLLGENRVTFTIGRYNHARPLIIDPVLVYSTYLGGSGGGQGNGIAVDSAGNAYVVGTTSSTNFPVTAGSFQSQDNAANGAATVFISKLNPSGTALVYSTYLGGSGGDFGYGIALDAADNAYVTGATYSTDFPVTCTAFLAADPSKTAGAPTAFVAELTANGAALVYSTYLGGSGNESSPAEGDVSQAIALDSTGNAYVTGYTYSADFPVSDSAFQSKFAGTTSIPNAFVAKLSPGGTSLTYATYLGGSGGPGYSSGGPTQGDFGNAIAIDGSGDTYIAGSTSSTDFPVTASAFQSSLLGPANAFVAELNPAGTAEVYSTYLGGSGQGAEFGDFNPPPATGDTATTIAVDGSGNAYVAGTTTSSDFPVTGGVLEGASDFDGSAGFVTKLSPGGSALAYSTYLEGVGTSISGLAVDSSGTAYVTGSVPAASVGLPGGFQVTPDALSSPVSNANSAFVVKLNPSASQLNYATLLGGSSKDGATALALDATGNVYITGNATSADFPVTAGAFQTTNKAATTGGNAFLSAFSLASETAQTAYPALPTGIATSMTGSGEITLTDCEPDYGANAFSLSVSASLTPSAAGPPPTGTMIFTDSFNYMFPIPYQIQFSGAWGSGSVGFSFTDGENMDGPIGPFTVNWTASYYGDAVYAPSSVSGSVSSPGCPTAASSVGITRPAVTGAHIQLLTPGAQSRSGSAGLPGTVLTTGTPSTANLSDASSGIIGSHGPKFTPTPPNPHQNEKATRTKATSSDQSSVACLASPQTATPVLSIAAGTYTSAQTVTITDATVGAAIYYTTDSSMPTSSSTLYAGSFTVSTTETINAIAIAAGYGNSAVASATYTITPPAATPSFSPQPGTYTSAQSVTIADTTTGATIYYTTDGSMPTTASTPYTSAITVSSTETINAIASATGYVGSSVASATYTINLPATFSVSTSASSLTIAPGQSGTVTISVTPQNGFAGATSFSCSGLPAGVTCSFMPSTVAPSGGAAATTTLTVSASTTASLSQPGERSSPRLPGSTAPILAIAFLFLGGRHRRQFARFLLLTAVASGFAIISACGGSSAPPPVTASISVVATSGAIQQTLPLTITVQK